MIAGPFQRRLSVGVAAVVFGVLVLLPLGAEGAYCMSIACEPGAYDGTTLSVAVTAPKANATVSGIVTVTANPGGVKNQNVNRVEFYFDNTLFSIDYANPWKADWNTL